MNICSIEHEEICYDGFENKCPICETFDELQDTISGLIEEKEKNQEIIDGLNGEITELNSY